MKLLLIVILLISLIITSTIIIFYLEKKISDNKIKIETKYSKEINIIEDKFNSNSDNDGTSGGGTCSSISETKVKELIDAKISSSGGGSPIFYTIDGGIKTLTGTELGFEVSDNGNKIIFNKEVYFNKKSQFNSIVNIKIFEGMIVPMDLGMYGIYGQNRNKTHFVDAIEEIKKSGFYLCNGTCFSVENGDGSVYGRRTPNMSSKIIQGIDIDNIRDHSDSKSNGKYRPDKPGDELSLNTHHIPDHYHMHEHSYSTLEHKHAEPSKVIVGDGNSWDVLVDLGEIETTPKMLDTNFEHINGECEGCDNTKLSPDNFTNKNQQFYFIYWPKPWTWGNIDTTLKSLNECKITKKKEDIVSTPNRTNFNNKPWSNYIENTEISSSECSGSTGTGGSSGDRYLGEDGMNQTILEIMDIVIADGEDAREKLIIILKEILPELKSKIRDNSQTDDSLVIYLEEVLQRKGTDAITSIFYELD